MYHSIIVENSFEEYLFQLYIHDAYNNKSQPSIPLPLASPKSQNRSQRRRTTVFSESQHRILYQHFTHCNFPEPAIFRILASLIGLEAAVIKIWFQNERSRQRKRANFMLQGNSELLLVMCR